MSRQAKIINGMLERILHPAARRPQAATGSRTPAQARDALLITFRADGEAVPTPVWVAPSAGLLYASTAPDSGKVRRIRSDPRVRVAATGSPAAVTPARVSRTRTSRSPCSTRSTRQSITACI